MKKIPFLLMPAVFAAFFSCKNDNSGGANSGKPKYLTNESEPTLTAENPVMKLLSPDETGVNFMNQIVESYENNIANNINMYNGGGVGVGDFDNNGFPDIYFICSNGKNRLFLNQGGLKFRDATDEAGVASEEGFETAVTVVDINSDGWLDLYICRGGVEKNDSRRNKLFVSNGMTSGKLTFSEKAKEYGLDNMSASTGANFFDYDNDGDLDLYLLNYPTEAAWTNKIEAKLGPNGNYVPLLNPRTEFDSDRFYKNEGNGKFTDVSEKAGIWNLAYGLSVSVTDFNRDGWLDVYVANDFIQPDKLYINNKNGTFTDRIGEYFDHSSQHTMGTDLTDFDNDGYVDLYAVDMLSANNYRRKSFLATNTQSKYTSLVQNGYFEPVVRNVLQRNNGNGTFSDVGCIAGVFQTDWSWSGLLFDMDNDGWRDLHVTNGYRREVTNRDFVDFTLPEIREVSGGKKLRDVYPNFQDFLDIIPIFKARNFCFQNKTDWTFADVSGKWMTIPASWSCGSAWADFDNDGDLDLVTNNLDEPSFLYENTTRQKNGGNFLQMKFKGSPQNPFGVGVSVLAESGGKIFYGENFPTRGIFSSVEHLVHFGLGSLQNVEKLSVRWPDGRTQILTNVPVNQRLTLNWADASGKTASIQPVPPAQTFYVEKSAKSVGVDFRHVENEFNDFENTPMVPWKSTDLGPALAVGDFNGDGLDDFFIGNSFDQVSALYAQQPGGSFKSVSREALAADKIYEDQGATFFDADNDGDLDLFALSGGAEATSPEAFQARLYINADGKGNFKKVPPGVVPPFQDVCQAVRWFDFDADGDNDLIIGGRVTPGKWPLIPKSVILRNDRSKFTDVTSQVAPDFERCGMVTDLQLGFLDADQIPELVVVGEFMPIKVFTFVGGKVVEATKNFGFENSGGLWHGMAMADLDGDNDLDVVTGNFGLNTRLTASPEGPLRCYARDFDNNGTLDPIMAYFEGGKEYPLMQKEVLNKQMPVLKKKFLFAKDYGNATIDMVWPRKDLDAALNLSAQTLETCWWRNEAGKFRKQALPVQAQLSVVQAVIVSDFNGDSRPDIFLAGNKYGLEVETNRCDSGDGALFLGTGGGNFVWANSLTTGIWASKQARNAALLRAGANKKPIIVVANNNDGPQLFF